MKDLMLCLTASRFDNVQAKEQAAWIRDLGNMREYACMYTYTPGVPADVAQETMEYLTEAFGKVVENKLVDEVIPVTGELKDWSAHNHMFRRVADAVEMIEYLDKDMGFIKAFWFFEPDMWPVHEGWLDTCYAEYKAAKKLFWGRISMAYDINGNQLGLHMNGAGIYPKKMSKAAPLALQASGLSQSFNMPWDIYARDQIVFQAAETNRIQMDYFSSGWEDLEKLKDSTMVLHGCKDLSLLALLREKFGKRRSLPEVEAHPIHKRPRELDEKQEDEKPAMRSSLGFQTLKQYLEGHMTSKEEVRETLLAMEAYADIVKKTTWPKGVSKPFPKKRPARRRPGWKEKELTPEPEKDKTGA